MADIPAPVFVDVGSSHLVSVQPSQPTNKLFLRHLPAAWTTVDLFQFLSQQKPSLPGLLDANVVPNHHRPGENRGLGFAKFASTADAIHAMGALQGKKVEGRRKLLVVMAYPRQPMATFIFKNCPLGWSLDNFRSLVEQEFIGLTLVSVKRVIGQNYAFACFLEGVMAEQKMWDRNSRLLGEESGEQFLIRMERTFNSE